MRKVRYEPVNKYIKCHCEKRQMILLGWGISIYANILGLILAILFSVFALSIILEDLPNTSSTGYILMVFLPLDVVIMWWNYRYCLKMMAQSGHTAECSKKVALRGMWHQGRYSNLKVDIDPNEVDPQGDYGTPALGLLALAFTVNIVFLINHAYGDASSVIYPVVFICVIAASTWLIAKIKNMARSVFVICMLNIVTSGLLMQLYGFILVAKFV